MLPRAFRRALLSVFRSFLDACINCLYRNDNWMENSSNCCQSNDITNIMEVENSSIELLVPFAHMLIDIFAVLLSANVAAIFVIVLNFIDDIQDQKVHVRESVLRWEPEHTGFSWSCKPLFAGWGAELPELPPQTAHRFSSLGQSTVSPTLSLLSVTTGGVGLPSNPHPPSPSFPEHEVQLQPRASSCDFDDPIGYDSWAARNMKVHVRTTPLPKP